MRLIDVDEMMDDINRSIEALTRVGIVCDGDFLWGKLNDAIDNATSVELVTCKECKYWNNETDATYCDRTVWFGTDADDYCSFGERSSE